MYVAIDKDRMVFLYAHRNEAAVSEMAWIEAGDAPILITAVEDWSFTTLTDLELKLLYKNTTGSSHTGFFRPALLQIVRDLALRLTPFEANLSELRAQADWIPEKDRRELFQYIPGSRQPKLRETLFTPSGLVAPRSEVEEQVAMSGKLRVVTPTPAAPAAGAGRANGSAPNSTPARTRSAPTGAPRGSTRETIWNKADEMWAAAGKPTATATVLALRKQIMDALEVDGVKRTSSSNELGQWQKVRLTIS